MVDLSGIRETLYGLWEKLNDMCWPMVDALRLGDTFEKYRIPPILLPIAIILLIILLLMLTGGGKAPSACDNNGICSPSENSTACPGDCQPSEVVGQGTDVIVTLDRQPSCQVMVKLTPAGGSPVVQIAKKKSFLFPAVDATSVSLEISDDSGHSQPVPQQPISGPEETIDVNLGMDICRQVTTPTGALSLAVKDSATNAPLNGVSVTIAEMLNGQIANYRVSDQRVDGQYNFTLPSGKSYRVIANKAGYDSAQRDVPGIDAGKTLPISVALHKNMGGTGDLEVCVKNGTQPMTRGVITLREAAGNFLQTGQMEEADQTMDLAPGCYLFKEIPAGKIVSASMPNPPTGCVPAAGVPPSASIQSGQRARIDINVTCPSSGVGYLRIRVIGKQGEILTGDATITLWTGEGKLVPGNGQAGSLAQGSSGYTEEVLVPAGTRAYAWVRGMPSGYLDLQSGNYTVSAGQHKAVTIYLNETSIGNFTFIGVASPNLVGAGQAFTAAISKITYDAKEVTPPDATVTATFAGSPCNVTYASRWVISCVAPQTPGNRSLIVRAAYAETSGRYTMDINVAEYRSGMGLLTITPLFTTEGEPPLELIYDIKFNGQPVTELADQEITLKFTDSPDAYPGEVSELEPDEQYWRLTADVPYKGAYELDIVIEVLANNSFYTASYASTFSATAHSSDLRATVYVSKRVLQPLDDFAVGVVLEFKGKVAYGLSIMELFADETFYTMPWDDTAKKYPLAMKAPATERCSDRLEFLINDLEFKGPEVIHIIDLTKTMSNLCPLDQQARCSSVEEVRRCLLNKKQGVAPYEEETMSDCIDSGCGVFGEVTCTGDGKGDVVRDCTLDEADADEAAAWLSSIGSAAGRLALAGCLDMDNDGDVDNDDLACLRNVVSTKWFGDVDGGAMGPEGTCAAPMKGGFCFNIDTDSPLPGDLAADGNIKQNDIDAMQKIVAAVGAGVRPQPAMLDVADFNRDGTINGVDLGCLQKLRAIDFVEGEVTPSGTQSGKIGAECLPILELDCKGSKGDLNGDAKVDRMDLVLMKLARYGMVDLPESVMTCADVNGDGNVTDADVECMDYYFAGEQEQWMSCLDCEGAMPSEAWSALEICHDGWDNDCSGLKDLEDTRCECNANTPCEMKWDMDPNPGVNDGNYKLCRDVSWDQAEYSWFTEGQLVCKKDEHQCETQTCNHITKKCSSATSSETGKWYIGRLPKEKC